MLSGQNIALMDNTTIHGAVAAYHQWPPVPGYWRSGPYAVNLRSLMDVIEAVVLFDGLRLDAACNSLADPGYLGWVDPRREWQPFKGLRDIRTGDRIFELERFSSAPDVIGGGILATAAERVQKSIVDGRMRAQAEKLKDSGMGSAIQGFYSGPVSFAALTRSSFAPEAILPVSADLARLEDVISRQPREVANFAMFAFRGFYYEELAHLLSMSYAPHAFRSSVLEEEGWPTRTAFLEIALKSVGGLRESYIERLGSLISNQLNSEFGAYYFRAKIPSIATFVAGNSDRRGDLLPIALEIRNSTSARRFRDWVSKVQLAIDEQAQLKVIRDACDELSDLCSDLRALPGFQV